MYVFVGDRYSMVAGRAPLEYYSKAGPGTNNNHSYDNIIIIYEYT